MRVSLVRSWVLLGLFALLAGVLPSGGAATAAPATPERQVAPAPLNVPLAPQDSTIPETHNQAQTSPSPATGVFDGGFTRVQRRQTASLSDISLSGVGRQEQVFTLPAGKHERLTVEASVTANGIYGAKAFVAFRQAGSAIWSDEVDLAYLSDVGQVTRTTPVTLKSLAPATADLEVKLGCEGFVSKQFSCSLSKIVFSEDSPAWSLIPELYGNIPTSNMTLGFYDQSLNGISPKNGPFYGIETRRSGSGTQFFATYSHRSPLVALPAYGAAPMTLSLEWTQQVTGAMWDGLSGFSIVFTAEDGSVSTTLLTIPGRSSYDPVPWTVATSAAFPTSLSGKRGWIAIRHTLGGTANFLGIDSLQFYQNGQPVTLPTYEAPPIVDQTTCTTAQAGSVQVNSTTWKAQTFAAASDGRLTKVYLPGTNTGGTTALEIRSTIASGYPTGAGGLMGRATITSGNTFNFGTGISLERDKLYALVLSNTTGGFSWNFSPSSACYANPSGYPFTSINSGAAWSRDIVDFYFTTYMQPEPQPSTSTQTGCATQVGTVPISGSTWKAQSFVAEQSGLLTSVRLPGANNGGTTTVRIMKTVPSGTQTGYPESLATSSNILATSSASSGNEFTFATSVLLEKGKVYAIVVSNAGGEYRWAFSNSATCYANAAGYPYTSLNSAGSWSQDIVDFFFQVSMKPPTKVVLDQTSGQTGAVAASVSVLNNTWKSQTFKPLASGGLTRIELPGINYGGSTTLQVRELVNGKPTGKILGSSTVLCGTIFDFVTPVPLVGGTSYGIVVANQGGKFDWYFSQSSNTYANGVPATSTDGGATWANDIVDFFFTTYIIPDNADSRPAATLGAPTCAYPAATKKTVYVIKLIHPDPTKQPVGGRQIEFMTDQLISLLREGSTYHGYLYPNAQPALDYHLYNGQIFTDTYVDTAPNQLYYAKGQQMDVGELYSDHGLCQKIRAGTVDEVWIWDAGVGGLPEWIWRGPVDVESDNQWSAPDCTLGYPQHRNIATMVFNYTHGEFGATLESFGHRIEYMFRSLVPYPGCDYFAAGDPWPLNQGPPSGCSTTTTRAFAARTDSVHTALAACGNPHAPPNRDPSSAEYIYNDQSFVTSMCEDWSEDGTASAEVFNCKRWSCDKTRFHIWWMQNIPGSNNINKKADGSLHSNWWIFQ